LHPVEHSQSRVDAGLCGLVVATRYPKLSVPAPEEETGAAPGTLIVIVTHGTFSAHPPIIVRTIPVPVPAVTAFLPSSMSTIISRRSLAPCRRPDESQSGCENKNLPHVGPH